MFAFGEGMSSASAYCPHGTSDAPRLVAVGGCDMSLNVSIVSIWLAKLGGEAASVGGKDPPAQSGFRVDHRVVVVGGGSSKVG